MGSRVLEVIVVIVSALTLVSVIMVSCAQFRAVARTVNDVAMDLCLLSVAENPEVVPDGFNPRSLCIIPAVLDIFLGEAQAIVEGAGSDALRSATQDGGAANAD